MSEENGGRWAIPESWSWTLTGNVCSVVSGGTPKTGNSENFDGGEIPWVTPADLSGYTSKFISRGSRNITQSGLDGSSAQLFPAGTVLFSSRAPIGYVAIATAPMATNQGFKNFVPPQGVDADFLYYYLKRAKSLAIELSSGTTFREISGKRAAIIPLVVAPTNEQARIVAKIEELFSDLDAGVAALERAKANLKRYRAAVLKAAVEGNLTKEWRAENPDVEPASELLERILVERRTNWERAQAEKHETSGGRSSRNRYEEPDTKLSDDLCELPKSWTWATLDGLTHYTVDYRGKTPPTSDDGIPIISAANVKNGRIVHDKPRYVSRQTYEEWTVRGLPHAGDLVVTTEAPVAECALYPEDGTYLLTRRVMACQTSTVETRFLLYSFNAKASRAHIRRHLRGTTVPRILKPNLLAMPIPLPPLEEQRVIADIVEKHITVTDVIGREIETNLARASRLRQSILKRAFEGKLVPQDPNDEPASELLARIKVEREAAEANGKRTKKKRATRKKAKKP